MDADRLVDSITAPVDTKSRTSFAARNAEEAAAMADELVRGSIDILKQPLGPVPTTSGVSNEASRRELARAANERDVASAVIGVEKDRFAEATEEEKAALKASGQASSDKAYADQERASLVARTHAYFANLFGITTDPSAAIATVAADMRSLEPMADKQLQEIQQMQAVTPFDNFLEWFSNQIELPSRIGAYNSTATRINAMQDKIDRGIKTGQDAANFSEKGIPTITAGQAKATADKAVADARKLAADADEKLATQNVSFAVQKLANDLHIVNATDQMTKIDLENEKLKYQSMINEINVADTHASRLLKAAQLLEKLEETKGLDVILINFDRIMGHPPGTTNRYVFNKFKEAQRENMVAIGAGSLGTDPFQGMVNWYMSRPGPGASPETVRFFDYLRGESEKIQQGADIRSLHKDQVPAAISARLTKQLGLEIADAANPKSIFYELAPSKMIASGAIPAGSQLAKILEPFTKQTGPVDTNVILEAIMKELPNPADAGMAISQYYKKNMEVRNSVMNTSLANVKLPVEYKVRRTLGIEMSGAARMTFDLSKPEEATKFVLAKKLSDQIGAGGMP